MIIDIIEITDLHGEIEFRNGYPTASVLYNKIKEITDANPDGCIVIGGGDLFDYPPVSLELKGVPARKVLERMGMKVTALGNHECGWTLETINNETFKDNSKYFILCYKKEYFMYNNRSCEIFIVIYRVLKYITTFY